MKQEVASNKKSKSNFKLFEKQLDVRNLTDDLICQIEEFKTNQDKIESIDYAIKRLNDLKKEINS